MTRSSTNLGNGFFAPFGCTEAWLTGAEVLILTAPLHVSQTRRMKLQTEKLTRRRLHLQVTKERVMAD